MLILNIIVSANLILLFFLLFFRKSNALSNKILALLLINPGINFISNINVLTGNFFSHPYVYFFAQVTMFGFAPLVHMYITLLLGRKVNIKYPVYFITLAGMLMTAFFAAEFGSFSDKEQRKYLESIMKGPYPLQMNISNGLFILLQQVYFTISLANVISYRKKLTDAFSDSARTKISYATKFITLIWLLNLTTIILYATQPTIHVEYIYLPIVLTIIYFFILYYAFHYSVFSEETDIEYVVTESKLPPLPKETEEQPDPELHQLARYVDNLIYSKELYRNPDLTLELLAAEAGVPDSYLSMAINKVLNKNFYDFVNEKRIEKAKILLKELSKSNTVEYIGYESGFNSRASFYRAFKRHTGITPSEFQRDSI